MSVSSVTPVGSALAGASGATRDPAARSDSRAFDDLLRQMRGTSGAAAADGPKASGDETEDRFLKLLVAQMRNQDPLNPLDNAQVTTQLAQINTVKGIDKLNASLQKLVDRDDGGSTTEAAAMVGRRVLVEGNSLELAETGEAQAAFELAAQTSSVLAEVLGPDGTVVDSQRLGRLPAGLHTFDWDGTGELERAAAGRYTLRVTALDGDEPIAATLFTAAPVRAVTRGTDGVSLQLGPYGSRTLEQVRGIL
jgi:flagellar basal-body rod modification protein FlgD